MASMQPMDFRHLADEFILFGTRVYGNPDPLNSSSLYAWLCPQIASDSEVLALAAGAPAGQQIPHLFFAAVQFLLFGLGAAQDPLRAYYPNLTPDPQPPQECYPSFRAFCLRHAGAIRDIVATRLVQINEVQRCTALLPAFHLVYERGGRKPLALIEIGASAGLNLRWDHYQYTYEGLGVVGTLDARVRLHCRIRGKYRPPLPPDFPPVVSRAGIDLHPIDLENEQEVRWLRALIWPERLERAKRLEQAIALAREFPVTMVAGDALATIDTMLAHAPQDATLCVFHSFACNQIPEGAREQLFATITRYSQARGVYRVSLEWYAGQPVPKLELIHCAHGDAAREELATCEGYGGWLEWMQIDH